MRRLLASACLAMACEQPVVNVVNEGRCPPLPAEAAGRATDFLDSLGIVMSIADVAANDPDGEARRARLAQLGIRHVLTDVLPAAGNAAPIQALINNGIRPLWRLGRTTDASAFVAAWKGFVPAVALPEPDDVNSNSAFKAPQALQRAKEVHAELSALPAAERPLIVGFRLSSQGDVNNVGDISPYVDFGGFRSSIPPQTPEQSFESWFDMAKSLASQRPLISTFVGYNGRPQGAGAEGESLQAKYLMRLLLESFNNGVVRSYYSGLQDNCDDCNGGLLRLDGTPKPAYIAWQEAVRLVSSQTAPGASAARLPFTAESNANDVTRLRHTLMARADGAVVMFLWLQGRSGELDVVSTVKLRIGWPLRSATLHSLKAQGTTSELDPTTPLDIQVSDMPVPVVLRLACTP